MESSPEGSAQDRRGSILLHGSSPSAQVLVPVHWEPVRPPLRGFYLLDLSLEGVSLERVADEKLAVRLGRGTSLVYFLLGNRRRLTPVHGGLQPF